MFLRFAPADTHGSTSFILTLHISLCNDTMFYFPILQRLDMYKQWSSRHFCSGLLLHRCRSFSGWGVGPSLTVWGTAKSPSSCINSPPRHPTQWMPVLTAPHPQILGIARLNLPFLPVWWLWNDISFLNVGLTCSPWLLINGTPWFRLLSTWVFFST